ncbi:MAG: hemerythrin domain-containing protein [Candidatus Hydrogenedentes bacterium]|nr:hemerythrin domain-containing protein [Candidatus Hydrogenedentota bacterium]
MSKNKSGSLDRGRRSFIAQAGLIYGAFGIATAAGAADEHEEAEVSPAEDLMREHGVLKRILLVYRESLRRLDSGGELPPEAIRDSAEIIRSFIEDYHEKLEEDHLFPRFRKANRLVDLVDVLLAQHQAGRGLTDTALQLATLESLKNADDRRMLAQCLRQFIRMYEPHEAREDTVLFPAFRQIVSPHEYGALGEEFEEIEHGRFGEDGFDMMVERVEAIEKKLDIYELSQFTPKA